MKRQPGFTLADALLGLGILAITVILIQCSLKLLNRQTNFNVGAETNWYQAINLLESERYAFELGEVGNQRIFLIDKTGRSFYLRREADKQAPLALRGSDGGYIPLLFHVQHESFHWKRLNDHEIYLAITTKDHRRHEAIVQLQTPRQRSIDSSYDADGDGKCDTLQPDIFGPSKGGQSSTSSRVSTANSEQSQANTN